MNKEPLLLLQQTILSDLMTDDIPNTSNNITNKECNPVSLDIGVQIPPNNQPEKIAASILGLTKPHNPIIMEKDLRAPGKNNDNKHMEVEEVNHGDDEIVLVNKQNNVSIKQAVVGDADKLLKKSNQSKKNKSLIKNKSNSSRAVPDTLRPRAYTSIKTPSTASVGTGSKSVGTTSRSSKRTRSKSDTEILSHKSKTSKIVRSRKNKNEIRQINKDKQVNNNGKVTGKMSTKSKVSPKVKNKDLVSKSRHQQNLVNSSKWKMSETILFYRTLATVGVKYPILKKLFPNRSRQEFRLKLRREQIACAAFISHESRLRDLLKIKDNKSKGSNINQTHERNENSVKKKKVRSSSNTCDKSVDNADLTSSAETNILNTKYLQVECPKYFTDTKLIQFSVFGNFNPGFDRETLKHAYVFEHKKVSVATLPEKLSRSILDFVWQFRAKMAHNSREDSPDLHDSTKKRRRQ